MTPRMSAATSPSRPPSAQAASACRAPRRVDAPRSAHDARARRALAAGGRPRSRRWSPSTGARAGRCTCEGRAAELALDDDRRARRLPRGARRLPRPSHDDVGPRQDALRGIGSGLRHAGRPPQALAHHLRALAIAERTRQRHRRRRRRCARSASCTRAPATRMSGLECYQKSLALRGATGRSRSSARKHAQQHRHQPQGPRAARRSRCVKLHRALDAFVGRWGAAAAAATLNNLGATLGAHGPSRRGRGDAARGARRARRRPATARAWSTRRLGLGRVCDRTRAAHVEARMRLETALDVCAARISLTGYAVECHEALADLRERAGDRPMPRSTTSAPAARSSATLLSEASERACKMLSDPLPGRPRRSARPT